jgi:putative phosphoesterase
LPDEGVAALTGAMRIAGITDTHDRYPADLPARLAAADEIWHLGDVCAPEVLVEFELLGKPLHVVLGNNEAHNLWPLELTLERGGARFFLTHIPPRRAPPGVQFVLHGHTHVPRDETDRGGVRWLNPGCISRPNRGAPPSFGWLVLEPGRRPEWKLVRL